MTTTCTVCGRDLTPMAAADDEVAVGTVAGIATGPVAWACPSGDPGHDHHRPSTSDLDDAIAVWLTVARRTRLRRELRCGKCGTPFALPGRRSTRSLTIEPPGMPPVTLTFDLPLLRCIEDAVDNLPPAAADDLRAVATRLLDGAP